MANTTPTGQRPASEQDATPSAPVAVFRFGSVSAAVFTDEVKTRSGKVSTVSRVSVRRSYKNAEGAWEHTHTLQPGDLLSAAYALTKAYDFIATKGDEERQ
jgi:hypothetical protein